MKTLYLECNMGAAGDMLLSALYELLEEKEEFLQKMNSLGLPGVRLEAERGTTCGISGTHMRVMVDGQEETEPPAPEPGHPGHDPAHVHKHRAAELCSAEGEPSHTHIHSHDSHEHGHDSHEHNHPSHEHGHTHHHHASPGHIADQIESLDLPEEVKAHARAVYDSIAQAEAKAHGCEVGDVHFHEVGALDAVADVVGVCYAISLLGADQILASPVHVGSGTVRCAHGVMPVPAPATAALLSGIPIYGGAIRGELCTPTGAALLAHFSSGFGPMPVMTVEKTGVGIGTKVFEQANCVRAFWGETQENGNGDIVELTCNIDDMTPEALSFACARLLELGALDVYTVPGTMKKGRPGHVLTVLCTPDREKEMARQILAQTTTNGLRVRRCAKYFLTPGSTSVQTQWGPVRIKLAEGFGICHAKPEFDDAANLARKHGIACQTVLEEALRKFRERNEEI